MNFFFTFFRFIYIYFFKDDAKDKPYVLEMSWLCEATNFKHRMINEEKTKAARDAGEAALKAEEEESDDDDDDEDE